MKKTKIILISIFLSIKLYGQVDTSTIVINDTVKLSLERAKFELTGKKIEYHNNKFAFSIDGIPIFGTDGDIPKYVLKKATLTIGTNTYDLQVDNMYNPWFGVKPNQKLFTIFKDGSEIHLRGIFSDGAGTYGAEWLVVGKSSIRSILSKDEKIVIGYFMRNE